MQESEHKEEEGTPLEVREQRMQESPFTITYITHKFEQMMQRSPQLRYIFTLYALWLTLVCLPEIFVGIFESRMHVLRQALTDLFHSTCPFVVMGAVLLEQKEMERSSSNVKLTYGAGRIKIVAALVNCLFLLATSFFTFMETLHELAVNFDRKTERRSTQGQHAGLWFYMVPFAVVKVLLSGSFIFIFRDKSLFSYLRSRLAAIDPQDLTQARIHSFNNGKKKREEELTDDTLLQIKEEELSAQSLHSVAVGLKPSGSHQYLMHSFYLVCFIQMLENLAGVLGIIMMATKLDMFETSLSFLVGLVNIIITVPLFYDLLKILMQAVPVAQSRTLEKLQDQVAYLEGVLAVKESHFWTIDGVKIIGTLNLKCQRVETPNEMQKLREKVEVIFAPVVHELCVQITF